MPISISASSPVPPRDGGLHRSVAVFTGHHDRQTATTGGVRPALQRGTANTRWRDFVDIATLSSREINSSDLAESIKRVAAYRQVELGPLSERLRGFAELGQGHWSAWRRKQRLNHTPESFAELLDAVAAFSDPYLQ